MTAGYEKGYIEAQDIIDNLESGETIKVVAHSMGAAYAKGFNKGVLQYAKEKGIKVNIEFEVDLAPYQPDEQIATDGVKTIQISHEDDNVAGVNQIVNVNYYHKTAGEHGISTFENDIRDYIPTSQNNHSTARIWEQHPWGKQLPNWIATPMDIGIEIGRLPMTIKEWIGDQLQHNILNPPIQRLYDVIVPFLEKNFEPYLPTFGY